MLKRRLLKLSTTTTTSRRQLAVNRSKFNVVATRVQNSSFHRGVQMFQQSTDTHEQKYKTFNKTTATTNTEESDQQVPQGFVQKLKHFAKKYGITGLIVYFGIYYLTWLGFYIALRENWLGAGDVIEFAKKWGLERFLDVESASNKKMANIGLAWVITKFTEPLRFALTLLVTPYVLKFTQKLILRR